MMADRDTRIGGLSGSRQEKHRTVRDLLPEYATVEALGKTPSEAYPEVAVHLESCAQCRTDLDELLALTIPAYAGEVDAAPHYPKPDLSFLGTGRTGRQVSGKPWFIDELGRLVLNFSQAVLESLQQPSLVGATRGGLLYRYAEDLAPSHDLSVTVEVSAEDVARGLGRVCVRVEVPSRDPLDQAGSQVSLHAGHASWHGETDEVGSVDFAPVPLEALPQLRLEITPPRL